MTNYCLVSVLLIALMGCQPPSTPQPTVYTTKFEPRPVVKPSMLYDVETVDPPFSITDAKDGHEVVVKWLSEHPDRKVIAIITWPNRIGTGGISFISTVR